MQVLTVPCAIAYHRAYVSNVSTVFRLRLISKVYVNSNNTVSYCPLDSLHIREKADAHKIILMYLRKQSIDHNL